MRFILPYVFALTVALGGLSACATRTQTLGYVLPPDWESQVHVGQSSRDEVRAALGSPSTQSTFGTEQWYYISAQRKQFAFMRPSIKQEQVIRLTFSQEGTLTAVDKLDPKDARNIAIASKETPTEGHQMGFMEQLFGNLGRFNAPGTTPGSTGARQLPGGVR